MLSANLDEKKNNEKADNIHLTMELKLQWEKQEN